MIILKKLKNSFYRALIIPFILIIIIAASRKEHVDVGHNLQLALPVIGLGCSIINGSALDYSIRYLILNIGIQASKYGLGETALNLRPNAKYFGFPSGHAAASIYGASYIARNCVQKNPVMQVFVFASAGYVGFSRIEDEEHTLTQVIFGFLFGLFVEISFRKPRHKKRIFKNKTFNNKERYLQFFNIRGLFNLKKNK